MSSGITLSKSMCLKKQDERTNMSMTQYALAKGSIMYTILYTRLDASYSLSFMRRYQFDQGEGRWVAVKNILKNILKD